MNDYEISDLIARKLEQSANNSLDKYQEQIIDHLLTQDHVQKLNHNPDSLFFILFKSSILNPDALEIFKDNNLNLNTQLSNGNNIIFELIKNSQSLIKNDKQYHYLETSLFYFYNNQVSISKQDTDLNDYDPNILFLIGEQFKFENFFQTVLDQKTIDINQQNSDGHTPIINASFCENVESVHFLLKNGANPYIKNNFGENAFDASQNFRTQSKTFNFLKSWEEKQKIKNNIKANSQNCSNYSKPKKMM